MNNLCSLTQSFSLSSLETNRYSLAPYNFTCLSKEILKSIFDTMSTETYLLLGSLIYLCLLLFSSFVTVFSFLVKRCPCLESVSALEEIKCSSSNPESKWQVVRGFLTLSVRVFLLCPVEYTHSWRQNLLQCQREIMYRYYLEKTAKALQRVNHNAKQCQSQLGKAYALSI